METIEVKTLNEYQQYAGVTANPDLDEKLNIATLALGVAGEGGEVADHVKKYVGHNHDLDKNKMLKELGDVMWYVAVLSNALGFTLREVAEANIAKLAARYPGGFSVEASKNRRKDDE